MRRIALPLILTAAALAAGQALALASAAPEPERTPISAAGEPLEPPRAPTAASSVTRPPSTTATTDAELVTTADPAPVNEQPQPNEPLRPRFEELRLHCEGIHTEDRRGVACRWSESQHPRFAAYRLVRGDGETRTTVFRTADVGVLRHLDTTAEPGQRYHYAILVLDKAGEVIGRGGPVVAGVPKPPFEELRFGCERATDGEHRGIACRWSAATGRVRAYVLYRAVDGGGREAIYKAGPDGRLGHFDGPLRPGHRYTYAVVALDAAGEVIGGGGPVTIGIPPPDQTTDPRTA